MHYLFSYFAATIAGETPAATAEGRQTDTAAPANESASPTSTPSAGLFGIRDGTRATDRPVRL